MNIETITALHYNVCYKNKYTKHSSNTLLHLVYYFTERTLLSSFDMEPFLYIPFFPGRNQAYSAHHSAQPTHKLVFNQLGKAGNR